MFNEQDRKEQVETAGRQLYIFYVLRAQERDVSFYTEWAYKHFVIIVAVHKMDFEGNKNGKRRYLENVMGKKLVSTHKPGTGHLTISY